MVRVNWFFNDVSEIGMRDSGVLVDFFPESIDGSDSLIVNFGLDVLFLFGSFLFG